MLAEKKHNFLAAQLYIIPNSKIKCSCVTTLSEDVQGSCSLKSCVSLILYIIDHSTNLPSCLSIWLASLSPLTCTVVVYLSIHWPTFSLGHDSLTPWVWKGPRKKHFLRLHLWFKHLGPHTSNLQISHLERKMIWTKPPWLCSMLIFRGNSEEVGMLERESVCPP